MSLSTAAEALSAEQMGQDVVFAGVSTDTRTLNKDDLFIALKGPNFNGQHFVAKAKDAGAIAAILEHKPDVDLPYIEVDDTHDALGKLAGYWRQQFDIPVIGITGSNGKTTVKEMISSIMSQHAQGMATLGNLNNDIGAPLTLLRMRKKDRYAVIEMGMNHAGEIDYLTRLAKPTVALITNAAIAHLAGLGSLEAIAHAKGEIFSGLSEDGVAIINADDEYAEYWKQLVKGKEILTFGIENAADFSGEYELDGSGSLIHLKTTLGDLDMRLPLLGKHNVLNAAAATAASVAAGSTLENVKTGLSKLKSVSGRLETKAGLNGARIIDDTYNANPASVSVGLEVLKQIPGERILVLGDMAELGSAAPAIHKRVGELAKRVGVARLFAIGELTKVAATGFGTGAKHYQDQEALVNDLSECLDKETTVLIKGSRLMQMEKIVAGVARSLPTGSK
jgi:UDP-N-acetylmuramoyl-tripeptide--D-alanyl-D-alanine ligase